MRDPAAGAVVLFEGVTREVAELDYEAYAEMAEEKLRAIGEEVAAAYGLSAVALEHRTGTVPLGEPSVIVAASAPHRGEAFDGARALIDRVKAEAPIWKVEVDAAGVRTRVEGLEALEPAVQGLPRIGAVELLGGASGRPPRPPRDTAPR